MTNRGRILTNAACATALASFLVLALGAQASGVTVYGYFNNHYAGYAIGSIDLFREMWEAGA
jgi:hypothetical protein